MVVVIQQANPFSYCYSSSNESTPRGWPSSKESDQGKSIIGKNAFLGQILIWYNLKLTEKRE